MVVKITFINDQKKIAFISCDALSFPLSSSVCWQNAYGFHKIADVLHNRSFLNFEHNNPWHRINVGFDLGSCNPICFQTRGLKGAKMDISANYMAILFSSDFDIFINEFLSKILFRNMHNNYYHFWHKMGQKGEGFKCLTFLFFIQF